MEEEIILMQENNEEEIMLQPEEGSGGGSNNYDDLYNKPILNGVTIQGNKISDDYNIQDKMDRITNSELETLFQDF